MPISQARYTPHGVWNVAAERVGHRSLSETAVFLFGKDADAGERAQEPIEWIGVKTLCGRNFLRGFRTRLNFVGEPQLGGYANNLCNPATRRQL